MAGMQCYEHPPALDGGAGRGAIVEEFGGIRSYVVGDPHASLSVLIVSDVFGFEAPKLRMIAVKIAAAGYFVVVPDFFYGDAFVSGDADRPIKIWIKEHSPEKGFENAKNVVTALKQKGASSVGAAGFCWGGKVVTELAKSRDIETGVLLHPSFTTIDDIEEVKVPLAILAAEIDTVTPVAMIKKFEEILSSNEMYQQASYVKIYSGVVHGWTVRYKDEDEFVVKKAEEAHEDLLNWLNKILKP